MWNIFKPFKRATRLQAQDAQGSLADANGSCPAGYRTVKDKAECHNALQGLTVYAIDNSAKDLKPGQFETLTVTKAECEQRARDRNASLYAYKAAEGDNCRVPKRTSTSDHVQVNSGTPDLSLTRKECEALNLYSTWLSNDVYPSGCIQSLSTNKIFYNTQTNQVACNADHNCIQKPKTSAETVTSGDYQVFRRGQGTIDNYTYATSGAVDPSRALTRDECYKWAADKGITDVGDNTSNSGPGCVTNGSMTYMRYNPENNPGRPCGTAGEKCIMWGENAKLNAKSMLDRTDWYVVRKADDGTAIPSSVQTYRDGVRTKATAHETAVSATTNVTDLIAVNIGDGWPDEPST